MLNRKEVSAEGKRWWWKWSLLTLKYKSGREASKKEVRNSCYEAFKPQRWILVQKASSNLQYDQTVLYMCNQACTGIRVGK